MSDLADRERPEQAPRVGPVAIGERLHPRGAICDRITSRIEALGVIDGKIFVQLVDDVDSGDSRLDVPVLGILSTAVHRVTEWLRCDDRAPLPAGTGVAGAAAR